MPYYLIQDESGNWIARYNRDDEPPKPDDYNGHWEAVEVSRKKAGEESVDWWDEQS